MPQLQYLGIEAPHEQQAEQLSLAAVITSDTALFLARGKSTLVDFFASNARRYIDAQLLASGDIRNYSALPVPENFVEFLFSTQTAYNLPVALAVVANLQATYNLKETSCYDVQTVLHEAIANAVIHGNLGQTSGFDDLEGFTHYYQRIEDELLKEDPPKRISVSAYKRGDELHIMVSDEGKGFHNHLEKNEYDHSAYSGNGGYIIRAFSEHVHYHDGGRSIELVFPVETGDAS